MKTDAFFNDIRNRVNILVIESVNSSIKDSFEEKYSQYSNSFFYEQFTRCGGIIIDNWIRLYGCGELNVVDKNERHNNSKNVDILIGEDVLGGLFGIKNGIVCYFAPDTSSWESLNIYYTQFINWLINDPNASLFYKSFRWSTWKEDCKTLNLTEGYHFYPLLQSNYDMEKRDRKIVPIDELIMFNLNFNKN